MKNKQILGALSMDLKRVALGLHRKSYTVADRFLSEALNRQMEINKDELLPYMRTIIDCVGLLPELNVDQRAEDALMYSIRIQNYILYK